MKVISFLLINQKRTLISNKVCILNSTVHFTKTITVNIYTVSHGMQLKYFGVKKLWEILSTKCSNRAHTKYLLYTNTCI